MPNSPKGLRVLSENRFAGLPDGNILSWCPKMDLLAVSMNKTSIWVFRLNGNRVFSVNNHAAILDLQWNHSGKFFVVAGADSLMKVYDSNNGKLVNLLPTKPGRPITLTSWSYMDVGKSIGDDNDDLSHLFDVDLLKAMPRLSNEIDSVPENGSSVSKNSESQPMSVSVTNTTDSDKFLDCLLAANDHNSLSMTFNNLFTVSDILLPENCRYLRHATPDSVFSQFFLVQCEDMLQLRELKILVDPTVRRHLLEIIKWCAQLVSIINHIRDQTTQVVAEATTFLVLLDRHLSNLKDVLYEDVDLTASFPTPGEVEDKILETLLDMLVTGLIPASLKDFWLNQFGERGLMKVSAVGNLAYDTARKTLFGQITLALEKVILLLSNLEAVAIAENNFRHDTLGMSVDSIQKAILLAQNLAKQFYSFIWKVNQEQEAFNKFLNWCKVEVIEKLASEENDPEAFFSLHPVMDFRATHIGEYLEEYLFGTALLEYLDISADFDALVHASGLDSSEPRAPTLQANTEALHDELNLNLFQGIQQYIVKHIEFSAPLTLDLESHQSSSDILAASTIYITGVKGNTLTVIAFPDQKRQVVFDGPIIAHQYFTTGRVLVLYEITLCYRLDLVDVSGSGTHTLSTLVFDSSTFVKKPAMLTVNSGGDPSHVIGCVLDSSKREYVVFAME